MAAKAVKENAPRVLGLARIGLGFVFLWAFFDKLFGLGFATCRSAETDAIDVLCGRAWLEGGSPTSGFLNFGTHGPFADFYQGLAGNTVVDWLFMLGLLGVGLGLTFGLAIRLAAVSGTLMMGMMYTAAWPPENHPFIDDHIIYALVLLGLWRIGADRVLGAGKWWATQAAVKRWPILR